MIALINEASHIIDLWLPYKIKYDKTPGISLGIIYNDKLVYKNSFGTRDIKKVGDIDEHSLFHIASISKTFTSVAILQLQEKNKLKIDDKVSKYLTWFIGKSEKGKIDNITIRQLLSHSSGIFRDGSTPHWVTGDFPKDLRSDFSAHSKITKDKTGFKYSNYGFSILGLVIESVTHNSYEKYIQENILNKLGMMETSVDYDSKKSVVTGHGREILGEKRELFAHFKANAYAPATGFVSSVADLSKFASALSFTHKGVQILSLWSKKILSKAQEKTQDGDKYGLGADITNILKRKVIGHSGGYLGFITQFLIDQQSGLGIVVLTNSSRSSAHWLAIGIMDMIYRLSDQRTEFKSKIKINSKKYEGLYRSSWGDSLIVKIQDILIDVSPETSMPLKFKTSLIPEKKTNFFLMKPYGAFDSKDELVDFTDFKNGKAQTVVFGATPSKRVNKK